MKVGLTTLVVLAMNTAPSVAFHTAPSPAFQTAPRAPGTHTRTLTVEGRQRSYIVFIPRGYDPDAPTPAVLAFHGGGTNAEAMIAFMNLNETAEAEGFLVVYPNGTGRIRRIRTFNAGNCCGYAMRSGVDDVAFTRAMLDDLGSFVHLDERRVFATGMSNGAMMAYRVASELSDRIAAIAPVAGPVGTETIRPERPVPVLHIHGRDDRNAPFEGGRDRGISGTDFNSVQFSLDLWLEANRCFGPPTVRQLPDRVDDGTTVSQTAWTDCRDGSEVILYAIEGGGHTWPGSPSRRPLLGRVSREISANDLMWEFFQRHPLP